MTITTKREGNPFSKMTYVEFKDWCNARACDGQWSMVQAATCIAAINDVESVCVKGLFKKKANEIAKESAWKKMIKKEG